MGLNILGNELVFLQTLVGVVIIFVGVGLFVASIFLMSWSILHGIWTVLGDVLLMIIALALELYGINITKRR